jgi:hypothetical protein
MTAYGTGEMLHAFASCHIQPTTMLNAMTRSTIDQHESECERPPVHETCAPSTRSGGRAPMLQARKAYRRSA